MARDNGEYSERGQLDICIGQEALITTSSALASEYTACTQAVHSQYASLS